MRLKEEENKKLLQLADITGKNKTEILEYLINFVYDLNEYFKDSKKGFDKDLK
jgi:hypothetical protein